jgi:hypothetical protein
MFDTIREFVMTYLGATSVTQDTMKAQSQRCDRLSQAAAQPILPMARELQRHSKLWQQYLRR